MNAEDALARLAAMREQNERMSSATKDMAEQLKELRATALDENGLAEATVDSGGVLRGVRLHERTLQISPAVTADAVLEASDAARALMAELTREVVAGTLGSDSAAGKAVMEHMDRHHGGQDTDGGAPR